MVLICDKSCWACSDLMWKNIFARYCINIVQSWIKFFCCIEGAHNSLFLTKCKEVPFLREADKVCYPFSSLIHHTWFSLNVLGNHPQIRYSHQRYFSFFLMTSWVSAPSQQLANILSYKHKIGHCKSYERIKPIAHSCKLSAEVRNKTKWCLFLLL